MRFDFACELPAVAEFGARLRATGRVSDLLVAGSLAAGDYRPGVSDLDLVALVDGPPDTAALTSLHREFDGGTAAGLHLGCVYVDIAKLTDRAAKHPMWTHGRLVQHILSDITRAELVRFGFAVFGREPGAVLPPVSDDDVRAAARAELTGYWSWAVRRPWVWLDPAIVDLGLTSMARARHALRTGVLLTKSAAIDQVDGPTWLVDDVRARRRGEDRTSPRLRAAAHAWRDARRTVNG